MFDAWLFNLSSRFAPKPVASSCSSETMIKTWRILTGRLYFFFTGPWIFGVSVPIGCSPRDDHEGFEVLLLRWRSILLRHKLMIRGREVTLWHINVSKFGRSSQIDAALTSTLGCIVHFYCLLFFACPFSLIILCPGRDHVGVQCTVNGTTGPIRKHPVCGQIGETGVLAEGMHSKDLLVHLREFPCMADMRMPVDIALAAQTT